MAIGLDVTKPYLDMRVGTLATELEGWCHKVEAIERMAFDATKLQALGYSEADAPNMVTAIAVLVKVKDLSEGNATLGNVLNLMSLLTPVMGID